MWNFPLLLSCSLYMDSEMWLEMDKVPVVLPIIDEHLRMKWKPGPQSYSRLPRHTIASITRCSFPDLPLASNWKECRKECYGKFGCLPSVMQVQLIFMVVHLVLSMVQDTRHVYFLVTLLDQINFTSQLWPHKAQ